MNASCDNPELSWEISAKEATLIPVERVFGIHCHELTQSLGRGLILVLQRKAVAHYRTALKDFADNSSRCCQLAAERAIGLIEMDCMELIERPFVGGSNNSFGINRQNPRKTHRGRSPEQADFTYNNK